MGEIANILDGARLRNVKQPIGGVDTANLAVAPGLARLIPGVGVRSATPLRKKAHSVRRDGIWSSIHLDLSTLRKDESTAFLPTPKRQFHPRLLGMALLDIASVWLVFALEMQLLKVFSAGHHRAPNFSNACFYLIVLGLVATKEGLYIYPRKPIATEWKIIAKVILWTTLFTGFAPEYSAPIAALLPLVLTGATSLCVLCAIRGAGRTVRKAAADTRRNVLIVGSGGFAQTVAKAIERDASAGRFVKASLPEHSLRGIAGRALLRATARREFIDEIIVTTREYEAAEIAIQEALLNQLDVRVVPELFGFEPAASEFEDLGGLPALKICEQQAPEWGLAMKRIADVLLASAGLVALSPLLFAVSVFIWLDSGGPVLYRAVRVGRKAQRFLCLKFRTMIPEADALKAALRSANERQGAFFKISGDPRVTRVGRFLRQYSLDELPQLWNVLLGDMSLVGPRPHPPDDVRYYRLEDLQRLDFVPGITGLWQVTGRKDPSFENSVALDVEYIKNWSLRLDLRILLKTVAVVLQGSGA
jgi:exopolysaccharide biosynthesis polyprenyl glycosylphosphotransferase